MLGVRILPEAARRARCPLTVQLRRKACRPCGPCTQKLLMDIQCKVALVTGGATGIGYQVANELLSQNLYRVIIAGIDACEGNASAQKLNDCHGKNKSCFIPLNVNCPKQFEEVMKEVLNKFGSLDILVNNAGIMDSKDWELMVDTNLKGLIHGTLLGMKVMKAQKGKEGVIINITDVEGFQGSPQAPIYAASKGGATIATAGLGGNSGNVRVVALAPGPTETAALKSMKKKGGKKKSLQKPCSVGNAVVYVAQFAEGGSIWAIEEGQLLKVTPPDWRTYAVKETFV